MAAYTDTLGFNKGSAAFPGINNPAVRMEVVLNFATIAAARTAANATALAAADTLEVIPVPANTLVLAVGAEVTRVEGATATMDVGDSGSATRYLSNADLNALGTTVSALSSPYFYSAASNIRITLDHSSIDAAIVRVWAIVADCA